MIEFPEALNGAGESHSETNGPLRVEAPEGAVKLVDANGTNTI